MNETGESSAQGLLEAGTLVRFRVLDTHTGLSPDKENVVVRAELVFEADDDDGDPEEIVEWAAFGFLFTLGGAVVPRCPTPRDIADRLPS